MKKAAYVSGIVFTILLMIILLITSIEALTYWTPGYYEKEYTKYDVAKDVDMSNPDLSDVTTQMMSYLRGDRDQLIDITATIGGTQDVPFFNEREAAHMADVRGLFVGALKIRLSCIISGIGLLLIMLFLIRKTSKSHILTVYMHTLSASMLTGTVIFFVILVLLSMIIASDFSKYFIIFHHIFFNNDLWILNPATDRLINIVPEPFFSDTAMYIAVYYGVAVLVVLILSILTLFITRRKLKLQ